MAAIEGAPREINHDGEIPGVISVAETLLVPEKPRLILVKTVAVSGPSYAGKDLLVNELKRRHNWRVYNGKEEYERRKGSESGRLRNKLSAQKNFDRRQLNRFLGMTPENAELYETRLAGIIKAQANDIRAQEINTNRRLRQSQNIPELRQIPAVSLNLWAEADVRYSRAFDVTFAAWEDQQERLARGESLREGEKLITDKPTRGSVEALVKANQTQDVLDYSRLRQHRQYIRPGINPFSRYLRRPNGGLVYDWWIDTSSLTPEQVADKFEQEAPRFGIYSTQSTLDYGEPMAPSPINPQVDQISQAG